MQRILLALDARGHADEAAATVRAWMAQDRRLAVVMLYVTEIFLGRYPGPRLPMSYEMEVAQQMRERMERELFRPWLARTEFVHKTGVSIPQVICETATALACDTIVLGGTPVHGVQRWLGPHLSRTILTRSALSVFVVRTTSLPYAPPIPWRQARQRGG